MKQEHPSQRGDRSLWDLHESLLHLILARLDVYSLPSCALVCKTWSLIITRSPAFARLHASLHTSHTWFTLFTSPFINSMVFYDTLANRFVSTCCLDLVNVDMARVTSEQLKRLRRYFAEEELLATSQGLVLWRSEYKYFTVTNILTRKNKLLPSLNPQLCHIAFVGMAYFWTTMSYQVLLCGLPQTPNPQGRLVTCVYNSLTHCWTNATSTLSAEFFVPCVCPSDSQIPANKFARPRTCVWFEGHFYCVMGSALHLFNLETMEWGSVNSSPLPSELVRFYCLWEHKGELRLAGSVKNEESKFFTQLWCLSPSWCGMLRWKDFTHLPLIASKAGNGFVTKPAFAHGGTLCLIERSDDWYRGILDSSMVHFYVYDLAKGDLKIVTSIPSVDVHRDGSPPPNLAIHPCPFTSP